jgi:uric acid transporter
VLAAMVGKMDFAKFAEAPTFGLVYPFQFGLPTFDAVAALTMYLVMIVVMIESTGMFLALSDMTGRPIDEAALTRGLRADGVGTVIGGVFNTFPYTSFSQNVGLVGVTGVRSRWVTATGGGIMLLLGLMPKMAALVEAVPVVVLGGAGLVMFGMVAATGARILQAVDFRHNRHNLFIVAVAIGFGLIPLVAPNFFKQLPHELHPLIESGILLTALTAVLLNAFFNGVAGSAEARAAAAATTHGAEA